jgi:membrane protein YqaA with SNARE-associated domain
MSKLSLKNRLLKWHTAHPNSGGWVLFAGAFADASLWPFPITTFFVVLALTDNARLVRYIVMTTLGILAGAVTGYAIGRLAWIGPDGEFTRFAQFFFDRVPGFSESVYNKIYLHYLRFDFWLLFLSPYTPAPYCMLSVSSGVFKLNPLYFCLVTLFGQTVKYSFISVLAVVMGQGIRKIFHIRQNS